MPNNTKKTFETILTKTKIYLVVIAVVLILLCMQNIIFIIPSVIAYGLLIIYTFWTDNKNKNELDRHIQELSFSVDTIAKNTLINSPFPLVIVDTEGKVSWKSVSYINEFGNTDINVTLEETIKKLNSEAENSENKKETIIYRQIEVGKKNYQLIIEVIDAKSRNRRKKNDNMYVIYIVENTELLESIKKAKDAKVCTGMIMIDSYDELIQSMRTRRKN